MDMKLNASGFAALGSEARLEVVRILVRAGDKGLLVNELIKLTKYAPSTLAHHLRTLAIAGLIEQRHSGRATINIANYERLKELAEFIISDCCFDENVSTELVVNNIEGKNIGGRHVSDN